MSKQHWEIVNNNSDIISNSPEALWENACAYFKWCDDNPIPIKKKLMAGKAAGTDATSTFIRPYSIKALCLHCNVTEDYLQDTRNNDDKNNEYYIVVSKILYIIYTQLYEMAIIGEFNPIFTSRVLNIENEDKAGNQTVKVEIISQGIPQLSNSENEILQKLESEKPLSDLSAL